MRLLATGFASAHYTRKLQRGALSPGVRTSSGAAMLEYQASRDKLTASIRPQVVEAGDVRTPGQSADTPGTRRTSFPVLDFMLNDSD